MIFKEKPLLWSKKIHSRWSRIHFSCWLSEYVCVCVSNWQCPIWLTHTHTRHISRIQTTEQKMNDCHQARKTTIQSSFSLPHTVYSHNLVWFLLLSYHLFNFPIYWTTQYNAIQYNTHINEFIRTHTRLLYMNVEQSSWWSCCWREEQVRGGQGWCDILFICAVLHGTLDVYDVWCMCI